MNAERRNGSHQHSEADEYWLRLLTGEDAIAGGAKRLFRKIPSPTRCKLCYAPFAGPYVPILKMLGFRRWSLNQQLCRRCMRDLDKHQGGAEVPVSLLYTDVQGSTTLAECLENVAKKFTDRQMIDGYLQVYTDAIADRARPDLPDRR